jgi:hypothetical protein
LGRLSKSGHSSENCEGCKSRFIDVHPKRPPNASNTKDGLSDRYVSRTLSI